MNRTLLGFGAAAAPLILALGVALAATAAGVLDPQPASAAGCITNTPDATTVSASTQLTTEQLGNAHIIYTVSQQLALPARAAVIGIATAMQESNLRNLTRAVDHDSLGLFQQRPSQGWGSPAQLTDPVYASKAFYARLVRVNGWQTMPLTQAAQAVQRSAFPDAYAKWESLAATTVAGFSGDSDSCLADNGIDIPNDVTTTLPGGYTLPPGTPMRVAVAISWALGQLGTSYVFGGSCTDPHGPNPSKHCDCSSLVQQAYRAAGVALPRTTMDQVHVGVPVYGANQLRPGDLIFLPGSLGSPSNPRHVGIYLGNGLVVHAPKTGDVVKISKVQGYWLNNIAAIRRVVE